MKNRNKKSVCFFLVCLGFANALTPIVYAQNSDAGTTTIQQGTTGAAGSVIVNQTTTKPLYNGNGYSIGGVSSTTVTGGSSVDGSGNAIPNGTRGSTSTTTHGIGVTFPIGNNK